MKKPEYNLCRECGSKPIHDPKRAMNTCPHCGRVWTDEWAEHMLPPFWDRPVRVMFT
jgi:ribosomal protein L37E